MEHQLIDLRDDYVTVCQELVKYGEPVRVRGLETREMTGVTLVLKNAGAMTLPTGVGRAINPALAAVEALCMIGGVWQQRLVERAAPNYAEVLVSKDEADAVAVAYGTRIRQQLPLVMDALRTDPTTRQAVLSIWSATDVVRRGDKPCTLTLQFLLRDGKLECHTYMRSQDVWLGLGIDVFVFTQLQMTVANYVNVRPGRYVHHVGSLHAYERDFDKIAALRYPDPEVMTPPLDFPNGVHTPLVEVEAYQYMQQARTLLDGVPSALNPWYERQIGKLYESA